LAKTYFSVCLDCFGKPCLMVGGGEEAFEKSERFLEAGARLSVVSREYEPDFKSWLVKHQVPHVRRGWKPSDVKGKFFAINTVKSDPAVSERIYQACLASNCLISSYDQPDASNITMPALARAGRLRLAISSNGATPSVARRLRQSFEADLFDREFTDFVDWVAARREKMVKANVRPEERRTQLRALLKDFRVEGTFQYPKEFKRRKSAQK
jgi:precorrin-2 dehydrogenase/sirohydrochlorin ferrochelatase